MLQGGASASEFAIFQKLANPAKTDFSKRRAPSVSSFGADVTKGVLKRPAIPDSHSVVNRSGSVAGGSVAGGSVAGGSVTGGAGRAVNNKNAHEQSSRLSRTQEEEEEEEEDAERPFDDGNDFPGKTPSNDEAPPVFQAPDLPPSFARYFNPEADIPENIAQSLNAEIDKEKQGYLLELSKFEHGQGIILTRKYSMDDTLEEIQFEYDEIRRNLDTRNTVGFIRDTMFLGFQGVELANHKWGPILQLDGWAKSTMKDKQRYDHALERLYKQHWRKGNMSPSSELGWLIGSSMLMRHCKNKWGGKKEDSDSDSGDDEPRASKKKSARGSTSSGPMDLSGMMSGMMGSMMGSKMGGLNALGGLVGMGGGGGGGGGVMRGPSLMPIMRPPTTNGLCGSLAEPPVIPTSNGPSTISMQRMQHVSSGLMGGAINGMTGAPGEINLQRVVEAKDNELMRLRVEMEAQRIELSNSMREMQNMVRQQQEQQQQQQRQYQQQQRQHHQRQQETQRQQQEYFQRQQQQKQEIRSRADNRAELYTQQVASVHFGVVSSAMPTLSRFEAVDSDDESKGETMREPPQVLFPQKVVGANGGNRLDGAQKAASLVVSELMDSTVGEMTNTDDNEEEEEEGATEDKKSTIDNNSGEDSSDDTRIRHIVINGGGGVKKKKSAIVLNI